MAILDIAPEFVKHSLPSVQPLALLLQQFSGTGRRSSGDKDEKSEYGDMLPGQAYDFNNRLSMLNSQKMTFENQLISEAKASGDPLKFVHSPEVVNRIAAFNSKFDMETGRLKSIAPTLENNFKHFNEKIKDMNPQETMYDNYGNPFIIDDKGNVRPSGRNDQVNADFSNIATVGDFKRYTNSVGMGDFDKQGFYQDAYTSYLAPDYKAYEEEYAAHMNKFAAGGDEIDNKSTTISLDGSVQSQGSGTIYDIGGRSIRINNGVDEKGNTLPIATNQRNVYSAQQEFLNRINGEPQLRRVHNIYKNNYVRAIENLQNNPKWVEEQKANDKNWAPKQTNELEQDFEAGQRDVRVAPYLRYKDKYEYEQFVMGSRQAGDGSGVDDGARNVAWELYGNDPNLVWDQAIVNTADLFDQVVTGGTGPGQYAADVVKNATGASLALKQYASFQKTVVDGYTDEEFLKQLGTSGIQIDPTLYMAANPEDKEKYRTNYANAIAINKFISESDSNKELVKTLYSNVINNATQSGSTYNPENMSVREVLNYKDTHKDEFDWKGNYIGPTSQYNVSDPLAYINPDDIVNDRMTGIIQRYGVIPVQSLAVPDKVTQTGGVLNADPSTMGPMLLVGGVYFDPSTLPDKSLIINVSTVIQGLPDGQGSRNMNPKTMNQYLMTKDNLNKMTGMVGGRVINYAENMEELGIYEFVKPETQGGRDELRKKIDLSKDYYVVSLPQNANWLGTAAASVIKQSDSNSVDYQRALKIQQGLQNMSQYIKETQ